MINDTQIFVTQMIVIYLNYTMFGFYNCLVKKEIHSLNSRERKKEIIED